MGLLRAVQRETSVTPSSSELAELGKVEPNRRSNDLTRHLPVAADAAGAGEGAVGGGGAGFEVEGLCRGGAFFGFGLGGDCAALGEEAMCVGVGGLGVAAEAGGVDVDCEPAALPLIVAVEGIGVNWGCGGCG